MKKLICLCVAAAMLACVFAGCANNGQKETEPQGVKILEVENGKITAENVSPYEGKYLEYGDVEMVSGICAVKFTNTGDQTISNAQLIFSDGTQELSFWLEMLPVGQSVTVAEQNQLTAAAEELQYVDGKVEYLEAGLENAAAVEVSGNGDGTIQIRNVTEEMLPLVRVFYRPADEQGNPIGGLCRSVLVDGIEAGTTVNVAAEGWDETCVVVTVLVINE